MTKQVKTMKLKYIKAIGVAFFVLLMTATQSIAQTEDQVIDKIIAKVDNYIILKSDLETAYYDYLSNGQSPTPDLKCKILESLITNKLLVAKADIDSVVVSNEEVANVLDRKLQYFISQVGSEKKLEEYYGKTLEQFKEELKEREKEQLIIQKMQQTITEGVTVTPAEVKSFFKGIPADSLPFFSKEVTVGQLVKKPTISKTEKEKAKKQLYDLKARITAGEDFGDLAKKYSQEPIAKNTGGDLGFQPRGVMDPKFEAAALSLKKGDISKPFESSFGWHIVQLIDRRGNLYHSRHIIIIPEVTQGDLDRTIAELDSMRTLIVNDSLTFEAAASEHSDDKGTSGSGGYFLDGAGSNSVSVKELDPTVYFTIDTMKVGNVSKPMVFKQADGKQAVRIFYYKNNKRPHQANLKDDYQKLYTAKLNEKQNRVIGKWFNESKTEVFIELDDEYNKCDILKE